MRKPISEINIFLHSQAFADGFRTTFAVLLPALLGLQFGWLDMGLTIALGALCVSLTDAPGPLLNKRNGMLICAAFLFIVGALTIFVKSDPVALGLAIVLVTFFFSMFNIYGGRATAVGNAAILALILTMDKPVPPTDWFRHSMELTIGGLWYFAISVIFYKLRPYRAAQRSLGDSLREIANYLSIKAAFYDPSTDIDADYRKLVAQQIVVHEKQDNVREILFKTRQIVNESTPEGKKLVYAFVESLDLFEDITATYYDYTALRSRFADTGILQKISALIQRMAISLDGMGRAIHLNSQYESMIDWQAELTQLKMQIDALPKMPAESHLVLKKILVNLRRLVQRHQDISRYFGKSIEGSSKNRLDHTKFVTHQPLDASLFINNLSLSSIVFRHSLRVAACCLAGYIITRLLNYGEHSYWVLLTIAFILKPAFSLTKQRNIERITGTLAGGAIGILILYFIQDRNILFLIMVVCMILTYSFLRINYLLMVVFTTPFVLILFSFLGIGFAELAKERVFDTLMGCAIALSAGIFVFPSWEKEFLMTYLRSMLQANRDYLKLVAEGLAGKPPELLRYKLVRKEVYVHSANLSAAFQRMLSEPRKKQLKSKSVHQFIVLNHILFSNIATVATGLMRKDPVVHASDSISTVKKALSVMDNSMTLLGADKKNAGSLPVVTVPAEERTADENLLKDQLEFIHRISEDIERSVSSLVA